MKLNDLLLKDTLNLSFEVFPPKQNTAFEAVKTATEEIAKLKPSFISVTYGAGGGTSKYTLDIAKDIKSNFDVSTLAHLTCVSSSRDTVKEKISELKEYGIENVMALRGDLTPELEKTDRTKWQYNYAIDLVRELKESGAGFCIGGACYPEIHPESRSQEEDIKYLKKRLTQVATSSQHRCSLIIICFIISFINPRSRNNRSDYPRYYADNQCKSN